MTWTLHDPATGETYVMPIGPGADQGIDRQSVPLLSDVTNCAAVLLTQPTPPPRSFTGTLLDAGQYYSLERWAGKGYPVQIVDDRSRTTNVLITDWTPVRVWKAGHPWYHTWTLRVLVLDATA